MVRFHGLCDGKRMVEKKGNVFGFCAEKSSFFAKFLGALSNR